MHFGKNADESFPTLDRREATLRYLTNPAMSAGQLVTGLSKTLSKQFHELLVIESHRSFTVCRPKAKPPTRLNKVSITHPVTCCHTFFVNC